MPSIKEVYQNFKETMFSRKNKDKKSGEIREKQTKQLEEDISGLVVRLKLVRLIRTKKAGEIEISETEIHDSIYQCLLEKDKPDPDMAPQLGRNARNLTTAIVRMATDNPLFVEDVRHIDKIEMLSELKRTAADYTNYLDKTGLQNLNFSEDDV